jgi:aspartyl-tRNA(Asn)/glutamyl-tRNA(Gln) amidotransferase subunit A
VDLLKSSAQEIVKAIQSKAVSAKEVCTFFLARAQQNQTQLNAYITFNENLLLEAEAIDQRLYRGEEVGRLAGIPLGIKDMFCTKGLRTTAGSKMLENFVPPYDATAVARIKQQGGLILGKLNQDEFAMGSSNETSYFGVCRNPWNKDFVPGGSSGGSATSQAARLAPLNLGTDTGGSIRQPASFCGVVGIKPTYGRISRYGIIAYASSLDQAGVFSDSVADAAFTLEIISGFDDCDGTTAQKEVPKWSSMLNPNIKGLKVGVLQLKDSKSLDGDVQKTMANAAAALTKMGAELVPVDLTHLEAAVPVYYLIAASEASSNLARYDGVRYGYRAPFENLSSISLDEFYGRSRQEGFGAEVRRRIMLGTYCLSSGYYDAYYNKASQVRRLLVDDYRKAFASCDVILSPVATSPAFRIGERISDPLAMYLNDIYTTSINLAGLPAMSLPFGMATENRPIGIQLIADHFQEQKMLNIAFALEQNSPVKGVRSHV